MTGLIPGWVEFIPAKVTKNEPTQNLNEATGIFKLSRFTFASPFNTEGCTFSFIKEYDPWNLQSHPVNY